MDQSNAEDTKIYKVACTCKTMFEKHLTEPPGGIEDLSQLNEQYQRFKRWAGTLGVLAVSRISLDERLRVVPDIRDWVLELLGLLEVNLEYYRKADLALDRSQDHQDIQSEPIVDAATPLAQVALEGIQQSINRLHWLGNVIRKSSTAHLASRVSKFASRFGDEEELAERMSQLIVRGLYPGITEAFSSHLAKSISLRRQRLLYQKARQIKMETPRRSVPMPMSEPQLAEEGMTVLDVEALPITSNFTQRSSFQPTETAPTVSSTTRPSTINPDKFKTIMDEQTRESPIEDNQTVTSVAHGNPYPKAPEWSDNKSHCQCDWCFQDIPFTIDEDQWTSAWRSHFNEDLQPYICISEECFGDVKHFASRRSWRQHMDDNHSLDWTKEVFKSNIWYCTSDQHGFEEFPSLSSFKKHLTEKHHGEFGIEEREIMASYNTLPRRRGPLECPLGGYTCNVELEIAAVSVDVSNKQSNEPNNQQEEPPRKVVRVQPPAEHSDLDDEDRDGKWQQTYDGEGHTMNDEEQGVHLKFTNHIAKHLKSLAFISLRYFDDETSSATSGGNTFGDKKSNSESEDESLSFEDQGFQEPYDETVDDLGFDATPEPAPDGLATFLNDQPQNEDLTQKWDDTIAEKNELRRRTTNDNLSSGQLTYPGRPELFVHGPGGDKRAINEDDYRKFSGHIGRRFAPSSEAGESEWGSSVTSISHLGFDAAPEPAPDGFATVGLNEVAEDDIEKSILKSIEANLQMSKMDSQQYLPLDKFEAIFSSQAVELLMRANASKLAGDPQQRYRQIMGFEHKCFRRILATLVMVQQVSYIEDFIDNGIGDAEVPIRRGDDGVLQGFTCRNDTKIIQFLQRWSRSSVELFFIYQRMFFVPFFDIRDDQLCSYEFGAEIRLPWQEYEAKTSGGHGLIHKIQIHPNHFRFRSPSANVQPSREHRSIGGDKTNQKPLYFALKEIFTLDREAHRQELHALEKSFGQKQSERHIIKLLLTFQHGERCYLLFEWADGNLEEFWDSHKVDRLSDSWALKQCLGIATALKRIHGTTTWQEEERKRLALEPGGKPQREWGRHGDIKPRNILWFRSHGDEHHHLVISDLGLTQFHSELTRSAVPVSRIGGFTEAYRPPEMELGRNISQSYDIWSLGCVLLEFCLWYVFDADAIREFEDGRLQEDKSDIPGLAEGKFFNIIANSDERKALLKPVVGNTIQALRESEKCTPLITEILRLLQDNMLQIEPKDRSSISEICRSFQDVKASMPEDAGLPSQKVGAHVSPPSLTVDTEVIGGKVNDSPQLDVPQRDVDLYYVHGGPGSSILDSTQIHPRHRALSIESGESERIESAESEGESYDTSTETNINTATDRSVHPPEFPPELLRDNAEARRQRRSAAVNKDNGQKE